MNKLFDSGLYRLGLRRTRVAGVCSGIVCVVGSALVPLINMITQSQRDIGYYSFEVSYAFYAILLWGLIALAPIIMYTAFSFLTNRRDSDFYHSLPATRSALYFSFFAAGMTWIWGILLVTVIVSGLLWLPLCLTTPYITLSMTTVWTVLLHFGVSTLCTAAFVPAALAATGTPISAIGLYGCVMLLPKMAIWIFSACLAEYAPFIYISSQLEDYLTFMLFEPLSLMIRGPQLPPLIYSAVLALVHVAAGWLIFRARRSESAGMPAPGKWQQTLYRTLISLQTAMLFVYVAFFDGGSELLWVLGVATVVIYYLYELITTKKLRSMLSATRSIWILPLFAALFAGCIWLTGISFWASTPTDPNDIDYVRLAPKINDTTYYRQENNDPNPLDYFACAEEPIRDKDVHRVVTGLLSYNHRWNKYQRYNYVLVELTTKSGRTVVRRLCGEYPSSFNNQVSLELENVMQLIPSQYRDPNYYPATTDSLMAMAYALIPTPEYHLDGSDYAYSKKSAGIYIKTYDISGSFSYIQHLPQTDNELAERLLETYISEFNALSREQRRYLSMESVPNDDGAIRLDSLTVTPHSWCYPLMYESVTLHIDAKLTPHSYELLTQLYESVKDELDNREMHVLKPVDSVSEVPEE